MNKPPLHFTMVRFMHYLILSGLFHSPDYTMRDTLLMEGAH